MKYFNIFRNSKNYRKLQCGRKKKSCWCYKYNTGYCLHGEKKLLNQQMSSAGIGTADFFCNIYRFFCWIHRCFCWIHRLFVNSTDEPVKSTEMSVHFRVHFTQWNTYSNEYNACSNQNNASSNQYHTHDIRFFFSLKDYKWF